MRHASQNIRIAAATALAVLVAGLIAACGGSAGNDEDPQQVLSQTFNNPTGTQSGTFDLDFKIETNGGSDQSKLEVKLGGPFQRGQNGQFAQFAFDASLKLEGDRDFSGSGGITSTGSQAFVKFQGNEYEVPQNLFDQFSATFAQLQSQSNSRNAQGSGLLKSLGISPENWLTDLKNEGTEDVQGTKTIHISGTADVPKFVQDIRTIAQKVGAAAGNVNTAELDQLSGLVKSAEFDLYSGETDKILRRISSSIELTPPPGTPGAPDSVDVNFELTLGDVNKPQTITPPANAQPLDTLLQSVGISPDLLGAAISGGLENGGAPPTTGGSTKAPTNSATQAYLQCLRQAQGQAALQRCASLLGQ